MEHLTAIKVIERLAQDINTSQDPKGVLLKFANDNNLAPAELERLGQVYNSAKTLSHLEKSANRGDTYTLLDISDLMKGFLDYEHPVQVVKQASNIVSGGVIPNLFEINTLEKAASEQVSEFGTIFMDKLLNKAAEERKSFLYELPDVIYELKSDINKQASEIVRGWYNKNVDPQELLEKIANDSFASPDMNEDAIALVSKKAPDYFGTVIDLNFNKSASRKVVSDSTGFLGQFEELQDKINVINDLSGILKEALSPEDEDKLNEVQRRIGDQDENEPEHGKAILPGSREAEIADEIQAAIMNEGLGKTGPNVYSQQGDTGTQNAGQTYTNSFTQSPPKRPESKSPSSILAYLVEQERAQNRQAPEKKERTWNTGALESLKGMVDEVYENRVSKHFSLPQVNRGYAAAKVDKRVASVEAAATIAELMQDPVIAAHSPQTVVSIYNSLSQLNPSMMRDKNVAKFALRESLQYDGITPHSYGQLVEIEKNKADTNNKNLQARKEIYGKV